MKRVWNISDLSCRKFSPRTQASYDVALEIAKQVQPKWLEKRLWNPVGWKQQNFFLEKLVRQKWVRRISFSGDTIQRRISDMLEGVKDQMRNENISNIFLFKWMSQQMLFHVLSCLFSWDLFIQETLKRSSCFVRNCKLQQGQMFWSSKNFFDSAELQRKYVCGVGNDGAPAMVESRSGFQKKFTNLLLKHKVHTCIIHRCALACRTLSTPLKNVMDSTIKL